MLNLTNFGLATKKYPVNEMPFLNELKEKVKQTKPYQGLKILQNIPLTMEAVIKIEPLILGGADVTVSCIRALSPKEEAIAVLQSIGVKIQLDHDFKEIFDVCLDCCGDLIALNPKIGAVELTQTGSELYKNTKNISYPIISVDDSKIKYLETVFGTGDGFVRAFIENSKEDIYDKKFVIFGYGKVGRGIVHSLIKYTDRITIVDPDEKARLHAEKKGVKVLDGKNHQKINTVLQNAHCIVTATGKKNVMSEVYQFSKVSCGQAYLANMGAEDEFGENFKINDVLFSKKPLNFSISEPTTMKYLDPVLYAHNVAIDLLLKKKLKPGYHAFPEKQAEEIFKKWCNFHDENILDIHEF